jgi:ribokinase
MRGIYIFSKGMSIKVKILCLGSLNIDHVYNVEAIVRPGETISSTGKTNFCGGKGLNQSIALARAGANVYLSGKIGDDGDLLLEQLLKNNVDTTYVTTSKCLTGHAIIQVDKNGQNSIVIFAGANGDITDADIDNTLSGFESGDLLLLQNETSNVEYAMEAAKRRGLQIALNPSPIDKNLATSEALKYVDWFIMNEIEGYEITGEKAGMDICEALLKRYPSCKVVLTLGEDGCIYCDENTNFSFGSYNVSVIDTTAAGDTFTGFFLACMLEGMSVPSAIELTSKAAAITVSNLGASHSIPTRREVEGSKLRLRSESAKSHDYEEAN